MRCKLPWFFFSLSLTSFKSTPSLWHKKEELGSKRLLDQRKSPPHSEVAGFIHNSCWKTLNRLNCHNSGWYRRGERERNEPLSPCKSWIERAELVQRAIPTPPTPLCLLMELIFAHNDRLHASMLNMSIHTKDTPSWFMIPWLDATSLFAFFQDGSNQAFTLKERKKKWCTWSKG